MADESGHVGSLLVLLVLAAAAALVASAPSSKDLSCWAKHKFCANGGTCQYYKKGIPEGPRVLGRRDGYRCKCTSGWAGPQCKDMIPRDDDLSGQDGQAEGGGDSHDSNPCERNPCGRGKCFLTAERPRPEDVPPTSGLFWCECDDEAVHDATGICEPFVYTPGIPSRLDESCNRKTCRPEKGTCRELRKSKVKNLYRIFEERIQLGMGRLNAAERKPVIFKNQKICDCKGGRAGPKCTRKCRKPDCGRYCLKSCYPGCEDGRCSSIDCTCSRCKSPFTGKFCETQLNAIYQCVSKSEVCRHGTCKKIKKFNIEICQCSAGYSGLNCEKGCDNDSVRKVKSKGNPELYFYGKDCSKVCPSTCYLPQCEVSAGYCIPVFDERREIRCKTINGYQYYGKKCSKKKKITVKGSVNGKFSGKPEEISDYEEKAETVVVASILKGGIAYEQQNAQRIKSVEAKITFQETRVRKRQAEPDADVIGVQMNFDITFPTSAADNLDLEKVVEDGVRQANISGAVPGLTVDKNTLSVSSVQVFGAADEDGDPGKGSNPISLPLLLATFGLLLSMIGVTVFVVLRARSKRQATDNHARITVTSRFPANSRVSRGVVRQTLASGRNPARQAAQVSRIRKGLSRT